MQLKLKTIAATIGLVVSLPFSPTIARAEDNFTTIPVVINILKNSGANEADAKKAVEEASKILKQAKIKLTVVKVNTLTNNDGDDGSGGGTAGDGELTKEEFKKVIEAGNKEIENTDNKKGIKITFAKTPYVPVPTSPGAAIHKEKTIVVKDRGNVASTGETIAHEIGHALTLNKGHKIDDQTNANNGGHAPNKPGKSGKENLMAPNGANGWRTGTNLTEAQIKELQKILEHRGKTVKQDTSVSPGEKRKQQHGVKTDDLGDQSGNAYFDLFETSLSSESDRDTINTLITIGDLFPSSGLVNSTYRLLFDTDANSTTGINEAGFLGIDREVQILIQGDASIAPFLVSGLVIDHTSGGISTPLPYTPLLEIGDLLFDADQPGESLKNQLLFDIPKSLLSLSASEIPIGIVSQDPFGVKDTSSLSFDLLRWTKDSTLTLFQGVANPGELVPFSISSLTPNSPFNFFIDNQLLFSDILDFSGGFSGSFEFPSGLSDDFYFLTAQDSTGEFAFNKIHPSVPEPSTILSLLALGTLGAASTLKRKLKPSQLTEKETTKVS